MKEKAYSIYEEQGSGAERKGKPNSLIVGTEKLREVSSESDRDGVLIEKTRCREGITTDKVCLHVRYLHLFKYQVGV